MKAVAIAMSAALCLCSCATSRVAPVRTVAIDPAQKRICVIENPRVKSEFLDAYRTALTERGYEVRVLQKPPPPIDCTLTSRYTAHWAWDLVLYLSYAELRVYRDGEQAGRAEFRARGSRFIDEQSKVKELVDQLLPK